MYTCEKMPQIKPKNGFGHYFGHFSQSHLVALFPWHRKWRSKTQSQLIGLPSPFPALLHAWRADAIKLLPILFLVSSLPLSSFLFVVGLMLLSLFC
jgi:hypothetical protein